MIPYNTICLIPSSKLKKIYIGTDSLNMCILKLFLNGINSLKSQKVEVTILTQKLVGDFDDFDELARLRNNLDK